MEKRVFSGYLDFFPSAEALALSTRAIHEFYGIIGYKLFNIPAENATKIFTITLAKFNFADIIVFNNTTTEGEVTISGKWEGVKVTDS